MSRVLLVIGQAGFVAVTLSTPPVKLELALVVMDAPVDGVTADMPAGSVQV